jgi:hypothetical protein
VTRVTVSDRQAPPMPALYGTEMARPAVQAGDPLQRLADCALCALGVISDKVTEGGVRQNAIAALVLLATCIPVAQTQPWEPGRTRLRAGITQGG